MIFTFITDSEKTKFFYEKRDCQNWQPLTLISRETLDYIEKAGNEGTRNERFAAYSLLFFAVNEFFGTRIISIIRDENGKPYMGECMASDENCKPYIDKPMSKNKKISFSISHSGGFAAVAISDEGECGIDIQLMPDAERRERIEKRFLRDFDFLEAKALKTVKNFYFAEPNERGFDLKEIEVKGSNSSSEVKKIETEENSFSYLIKKIEAENNFSSDKNSSSKEKNRGQNEHFPSNHAKIELLPSNEDSFLKKWTALEAMMKCSGGGFRNYPLVQEMFDKFEFRYTSLSMADLRHGATSSDAHFGISLCTKTR